MDKFIIQGGRNLRGSIAVGGAKNAVLPIMAATLLARGKSRIDNVPRLRDVRTMANLLRILGVNVRSDDHSLEIDTSIYDYFEAPYELVSTMRASVYVLGPLLAMLGKAKVSMPGGCAWGPRPIDYHLKGLQKLGAEIEIAHGFIRGRAKRLKGSQITLDKTSVGATGNLIMAATLAEGTTLIINAAKEPEIVNLIEFLTGMGAVIRGAGSDTVEIEGVEMMKPCDFSVIPDRIEAGTFMIGAALTGGDVELEGVLKEHCTAVVDKLQESGAQIEFVDNRARIRGTGSPPEAIDIITAPYPGFPTDLQAQMTALLALSTGSCRVIDTIYPDRFTHIAELRRMGADIHLEGNTAHVKGVRRLSGAPVMATDLRASAALVLAGLVAEGKTILSRVYHIDRGYEMIEKKLSALNADIERIA
jgi:UDP-N-acetylglucosamine 1-carboxyvinyltransferase